LLASTIRHNTALNVSQFCKEAAARRREAKVKKAKTELAQFQSFQATAGRIVSRRTLRAKETGTWLTLMPERDNGTELSSEEFRDSLRLRYGLQPNHLPECCDGCHERFSVGHAMSCKKGGLVLLRHNTVAREWHHLCAMALIPSAVTDEPLIHTGRDPGTGGAHGNDPPAAIRGDVAAHGFWKKATTAIFDIRITDTDAATARSQAPAKILARHEKEKKDKYLASCLERRRHFTPLVFSVDGLRGTEAGTAEKRVSSLLAEKWKRNYSEVCGFVRSRLSIALVRSASLCLRGARDPTARATLVAMTDGASLGLYR
jgi:hypothetical protein